MTDAKIESFREDPPLEELLSLLLPIEREVLISRESPTYPQYWYKEKDDSKTITVAGNGHTYKIGEIEPQLKLLESTHPDLLLVETQKRGYSPELLSYSAEKVVSQSGEQGLMVWWGLNQGIEVRSWDLPLQDQYSWALEKFTPQALVAFILAHQLKHLERRDGRRPGVEHYREVLRRSGLPSVSDLEEKYGLDFSNSSLDNLLQEYLGIPFHQASLKHLEDITSPRESSTEPNLVIRAIRERREENAIRTILDSKSTHDNIFVTCGASHAVTWRPVIERLYPEDASLP